MNGNNGSLDEKPSFAHPQQENGFSSGIDGGNMDSVADGDRKGSVIAEGAQMYGDTATVEEYGYVERALKSRHIQFIALGGTIGTGLFVGIGKALAQSGPLSVLLGYTIMGLFIYAMMQSLGEMVTWLPMPGAIPQMCARYADPALGFAVGWNQWYSNALTQCAELSAAATVIGYWDGGNGPDGPSITPAAWITILVVLILALNIFAVGVYGEAEFCFASIKLVTIMGLLILAFIIDLGGAPSHHRLGFQYWRNPGAMTTVVAAGNAGRFLSFWSTMVNAAFSYGGVEMVAVAAGEAENPRKNIPKAVKRTFWRIIFFYVLGSLAIGVMVPYTNADLDTSTGTAASSPWVIGIQLAQIRALPSIINAVILTSAASSGNAFLYAGSRYLFGLAQNGQAPKIFLKCTKRGLPWICVLVTWVFSLLTYLSVGAGGSVAVFNWFLNITTIANLFTWVGICIAAIQWQKACKAQGVNRADLPFRSKGQPYLAWAALVMFSLVILTNGWEVFTNGNWNVTNFITAYIGVPIFFLLYGFWKLFKRSRWIPPAEVDLWTGKAAIDNEYWPEQTPKNVVEKFWFWLC